MSTASHKLAQENVRRQREENMSSTYEAQREKLFATFDPSLAVPEENGSAWDAGNDGGAWDAGNDGGAWGDGNDSSAAWDGGNDSWANDNQQPETPAQW
ncbi:hypothetical protein SCUCBS95973_009936 [Sporothrix curviconia]|uniref:Uncharacterized protein n=1 Tax=Sporothrix curviconia TaxID=1260050 RepID=A0ABP0CZL3_9PEZI